MKKKTRWPGRIRDAEQTSPILLDSSAVLAWLYLEKDWERVESHLHGAQSKKERVLVSFVSFIEIHYCFWRKQGSEKAKEAMAKLRECGIEKIGETDAMLERAAELKVNFSKLSLADCVVLATAMIYKAHLVHKDPEFNKLKDQISMTPLH